MHGKETLGRPIYLTSSQQICGVRALCSSDEARGADSPHVGSVESRFQGTEQRFGEDNLASGMNAAPFMEMTKWAGSCSAFIDHV